MADTKVRRISKKEDEKQTKKSNKVTKKSTKKAANQIVKQKPVKAKKLKNNIERKTPKWLLVISAPFRAIGRYVAESFRELKQTHWPNRKTTWKLTLAVIVFTVFFVLLILFVDFGFEQLLEMVLNI